LFLYVKGNRLDYCFELTNRFLESLHPCVATFEHINGFSYMDGRDLSGFADGTRQPGSPGTIQDVAVIQSDEDSVNEGGSYLLVSRFVHDLHKFFSFSDREKSEIVGRDYATSNTDRRLGQPENPLLMSSDPSEKGPYLPRSHVQRGYGAIYRHAFPYFTQTEKGLYFLAFASFFPNLDECLRRMAGHFAEDGSLDDLFKFTTSVANNYYYCPSLPQLKRMQEATP